IGGTVVAATAPRSCASPSSRLLSCSLVLSPRGWVGLATGLFVGGLNVFLSLHPDSRFYPGRLGTSQPRGPELHPRMLYRILLFAAGMFVIWDSVWQFLHPRS